MGISENADSPLLCSREIKLMQYPKDDIQKEIMKAAEKVFLENGFPKASMREIAQEAQVGLSNIYNYFKSKDDIFCTVVRPVISAFERMLHEHHEDFLLLGFIGVLDSFIYILNNSACISSHSQ